MRKHNGMRPQDIPILLKIMAMNSNHWHLSDLSNSLNISISEVSESLNRSKIANLTDYNKKNVNRNNLMEFLEHGVRYVFPQEPGKMSRGIPTAHSHPFFKEKLLASESNYIWPASDGSEIGLTIEPFYPKQVDGILKDLFYYKLLALVDVIRVGKVREVEYAVKELKKSI
jgi:predicted transcriptional regulator